MTLLPKKRKEKRTDQEKLKVCRGNNGNGGNTSFKIDVYRAVSLVPKGKVSTYKDIAGRIGRSRSCRAVGNVLGKNNSSRVPCHRVVMSNGLVGGFAFGVSEKVKKLKYERIPVKNGRVNLAKYKHVF